MADLRFDLELAVAQLHVEGKRERDQLAQTEARLEAELRTVAAALQGNGPQWDIGSAAAIHILEIDTRHKGTAPAGMSLEVLVAGSHLGISQLARELEPARYRVIVQLTKIEGP